MKTLTITDAGICGFQTRIHAESADQQNVTFRIASSCEKVQKFADALIAKGLVDGYVEIGAGNDGIILSTGREYLKGMCGACVVPCAVFKAMQIAAGLALPMDIAIRIAKE